MRQAKAVRFVLGSVATVAALAVAMTVADAGGVPQDSARRVAYQRSLLGASSGFFAPASTRLAGISCATSSFCVAVGSYADPFGNMRSFAERWNGRTWQVIPGVHGSGLADVSCTSTRFCMAVGSQAERWNGRVWTAVRTPNGLPLRGISCRGGSFCMAVGLPLSANECATSAVWRGSFWRPVNVPFRCGVETGGLFRVSCASTSDCVAVGSKDGDLHESATLAFGWNGKKWQDLSAPALLAESQLSGASCPTATFCLAVGGDVNENIQVCGNDGAWCNVALTWNGHAWRELDPPLGSSASGLTAVSCTSATHCVALSNIAALTWDGTTWTQTAIPQPQTAGMGLSELACPGAGACMAAGTYSTIDGAALPLAEQWNGSAWLVRRTPGPGDAFSGLSGVSCSSATRCMAVGSRINGSDVQVTLAEQWHGSRWQVQATPNPGPHLNVLTAVSCPAVADCMAVGHYDADSVGFPLAEQWNGTSWTTLNVPHNGVLVAISCPAVNRCMAVGSYPTRRQLALSATWDGTTWTVHTLDLGHTVTEFLGVSCTSASNCIAVGQDNGTGPLRSLTARWDGTAWTVLNTRSPGAAGALISVSCPRPSTCMAVGSYLPTSRSYPRRTLAESWNGSGWQVRPTPEIKGQLRPFLTAVSCDSPARCMAVGGFIKPSGNAFELADAWNGTAWRRLSIPSPDPAFNYLYDVSCAAAAHCIAAGERGVQLTAAYQWNGARWVLLRPSNP